jgi:hypothetical protein
MDWIKALVFALITLRQSFKGSSAYNNTQAVLHPVGLMCTIQNAWTPLTIYAGKKYNQLCSKFGQ